MHADLLLRAWAQLWNERAFACHYILLQGSGKDVKLSLGKSANGNWPCHKNVVCFAFAGSECRRRGPFQWRSGMYDSSLCTCSRDLSSGTKWRWSRKSTLFSFHMPCYKLGKALWPWIWNPWLQHRLWRKATNNCWEGSDLFYRWLTARYYLQVCRAQLFDYSLLFLPQEQIFYLFVSLYVFYSLHSFQRSIST